ncbi:uncharacterized protein LOC127122764 [Lathyrus oleraceus]|uniref:uncharacterized protein LOC127122764 n=1 Tax=Pisum sativum TaxID=3888 RepID=UPI0021D03BA1|nr:uncharacterized protein LOC127122764 [Pisum sativum]
MDHHEDMYSMNNSDLGFPAEDRKYRMLEEILKVVEGQGVLGMDINDLRLVPGVMVPPKFKVPILDKYNGTTCPKTHMKAYYRQPIWESLKWYMHLERTYIRNWRDLVEAYLRHYQYNIDMDPNWTQMESLTQGLNESFKEYTHKWRELATRVQPSMMERELVDMFMGTQEGMYYDRMGGSTSVGFSELVMAGERIEVGLKLGKIQSANTGSSACRSGKKPFNGHPKKKESESNAVYSHSGRGRIQQKQKVNVVTIPVATAPQPQ